MNPDPALLVLVTGDACRNGGGGRAGNFIIKREDPIGVGGKAPMSGANRLSEIPCD